MSDPLNPGEPTHEYDVIVIGGGPAGASAAIYTARASLTTLVIDKGLAVGALGITGHISNFPGVPGPIAGSALLDVMREQAKSFGAVFVTDRVVGVDLGEPVKTVFSNQGVYTARAVVVATGAMGRANAIPGEDRLLGRGVSYCATCDGAFFRDRPVAVVGNNDEAVEEALFLTRFVSRLYFVSPTRELKAGRHLADKLLASPKVEPYWGTKLLEVVGDDSVRGVDIGRSEGKVGLDVDAVFIYLQGAHPIIDYLQNQLETTPQGCIKVDESLQASVPGVFAVGDLLCTHVKQAVIAAADGVRAALEIERYLSNGRKAKVDWEK